MWQLCGAFWVKNVFVVRFDMKNLISPSFHTWVIADNHVIILEQLYPPALSKIKLFLTKNLEIFVVGEHIHMNGVKIVMPYLERKNYHYQIVIIS